MMYFCFDLETNGLLPYRNVHYSQLEHFQECRMVSLAYIILDEDLSLIKEEHFIVKPDGFQISANASRIHGIEHAYARDHGKDVRDVLEHVMQLFNTYNISHFVAHNVDFDYKIFQSEIFRYKGKEATDFLKEKSRICTMRMGQTVLNLEKFPKLSELYAILLQKPLKDAHNARVDTLACKECFRVMMQNKKNMYISKKDQENNKRDA